MCLKTYTAQSIVNGPFPCRIRVTVEDYSSFGFAFAFFDCGYIVSGFFGKKPVNGFEIKSELK